MVSKAMKLRPITAAACIVTILLLFPGLALPAQPSYVGSKKCKRCHGKIYKQWESSWHHKTLDKPSKKTVLGDFQAAPTAETGLEAIKSRRGGEYTVTTVGPNLKPETFVVKYVLGGKRVQQYLTQLPDGSFRTLPVVWKVSESQWKDYHGIKTHQATDRNFWSSPQQIWNRECAGCHATGLQVNYDKDTNSYKSEWVEEGIGCEACHGPGSNHIRIGGHETIVPIKRLGSFRRRIDVCGQCHSQGVSRKSMISYPFPVGFLPGESLFDYFETIDPKTRRNTPYFWGSAHERDFHQEYMGYRRSTHFRKRVAECTTCHDPHGSKYPSNLHRPADDNTLCYGCHKGIEEALEAHTNHPESSPGSVCTNCHMSCTVRTDFYHDVHSHTLWVPSSYDVARYKTPSACKNCHPDSTAEWMSEKMAAWR